MFEGVGEVEGLASGELGREDRRKVPLRAALVDEPWMKLKKNWQGGTLYVDSDACCEPAKQKKKRW